MARGIVSGYYRRAMWVSPRYQDTDFPKPWSFQAKVTVFADQVFGWQLDVADDLKTNAHAGFAILSIVLSYFETIGKFEAGDPARLSRRRFKQGIQSVIGPLATAEQLDIPPELVDALYEDVRCGMYHSSITSEKIVLTSEPRELFQWNGILLVINPHQLVDVVRRHFAKYVGRLMSGDPADADVRRKFERVFFVRSGGKAGS